MNEWGGKMGRGIGTGGGMGRRKSGETGGAGAPRPRLSAVGHLSPPELWPRCPMAPDMALL